jgi:hypothetical protein
MQYLKCGAAAEAAADLDVVDKAAAQAQADMQLKDAQLVLDNRFEFVQPEQVVVQTRLNQAEFADVVVLCVH